MFAIGFKLTYNQNINIKLHNMNKKQKYTLFQRNIWLFFLHLKHLKQKVLQWFVVVKTWINSIHVIEWKNLNNCLVTFKKLNTLLKITTKTKYTQSLNWAYFICNCIIHDVNCKFWGKVLISKSL